MQVPRPCRFPHHAWLGSWEDVRADAPLMTLCRRQVVFHVTYIARGRAGVRWVRRGRESRFHVAEGCVRLSPADGERHTLIAVHEPGNAFYTLRIPKSQFAESAASEGVESAVRPHHVLCPDDPVLRPCMAQLASTARTGGESDGRDDEVARRLMLRLIELQGGRPPEWRADTSAFDARTLDGLVGYVDDHLKPGPRLVDMAPLVRLSPSHFAKKFRRSTGLSLHRFANLRRVGASFVPLRRDRVPLANLATDLGFSSQSHFTRLFGELTGVSPAKYRKQFRPIAAHRNPTGPVVVRGQPQPAGGGRGTLSSWDDCE